VFEPPGGTNSVKVFTRSAGSRASFFLFVILFYQKVIKSQGVDIMPRGAREKSESRIYHVVLGGTNWQEIFHEESDCIRYFRCWAGA
jgi:hypothetical protein